MPQTETHPGGGLQIVEKKPFNAETPAWVLDEDLTPNELFFVRNHFAEPLPAGEWTLRIHGAVERPVRVTTQALERHGGHERTVTLECAGNGRSQFNPPVPGTPWGQHAVSTATFRGVLLERVLAEASPHTDAVEALFVGADQGTVDGNQIPYARSLTLDEIRQTKPLLAFQMNDQPLPANHGGPLRLIVPGWYGMASVKWLTEIQLLTEPFTGWFQKQRYVYDDNTGRRPEPVRQMRVKSLILTPSHGDQVPADRPLEVTGRAWSGHGAIRSVELSLDGGATWTNAHLSTESHAGRWAAFHAQLAPPGPGQHRILSRATDIAGNTQPPDPVWNRHGYGYNTLTGPRVQAK